MILAAGFGRRLLPMTLHTPKPLCRVYGKTLIEHHLFSLAAAGIRDVVINLGHLGYKIRHQLGTGASYGVRIYYSEEGNPPLETAGGIRQAIHLLADQPGFLLINADIYTNYFDELIQHHQDEIKRIREEITETVKEVDEERSDIQCCCPDDEDNCIHINYELYRGRKLIGEYGECTDCGSAAGWAGEAGWDFGKDAEKIWNNYYKPLLKD